MMELYTGVDIVEIERIRRSMTRPAFLTRCFSDAERAIFAQKQLSPATVAAHFAAKEAFSKAMGTGLRGFALQEVSVLRDAVGAPYFVFSGQAQRLVEERGLRFSLSLSHSREHAVAMVVAYKE